MLLMLDGGIIEVIRDSLDSYWSRPKARLLSPCDILALTRLLSLHDIP